MSTALTRLSRNQKICGGVSVLTALGLVLYQKHKIHKLLSKLIEEKPVDVDKKTPDYIYIKYHIYRESMRKLQQEQEDGKKWINIIIHPIGKWWKAFKHSVAWRLLNIAQNGSQYERLKAVRQLAMIDHLKDWDFRHLAQICDARTAVSLARSGCDVRWFVPVHMRGVNKNTKLVLADLHKMLEDLNPNKCVRHFLSRYFQAVEPEPIDYETFTDTTTPLSSADTDLLKEVISFLHHITKDPEVSLKIIRDGGLTQLMDLRKIFAGDNETLSTLCKTIANMSLAADCVHDFFVSGWIRVLAEWQNSADLRLQVIAAKVLANLDYDDPNYTQYPPNIYPLYPRLRTRQKPKGDIVFIHGLMGGVFYTWRQKDRKPTELGLYGKNAFYTSEADDVFLVGETKRNNGKSHGRYNSKTRESIEIEQPSKETNIPATKKKIKKEIPQISDVATKELIETLQTSAELSPDWEVVHHDVPLNANENCQGEFSVSGNEWKNEDYDEEYTNCWPMEWLPEDQPSTRIIGIDYTSVVTEWSANFTKECPCEKNAGHIEMRASSLLERIVASDVGANRPVVWVGHSMGGILCKHILMKSLADRNPKVQQIAKNTKGIVFLGTPHRGSPIAKWKQHMQMILSPSIEVKEMEEGAPPLLALHNKFMNCLRSKMRDVHIVSIAEGSPTMLTSFKFPLRIVTEESAYIDYGDFYILKDDHLSLSKPILRQSFLYQRVLKVIEESLVENDSGEKNTSVILHNSVTIKPEQSKISIAAKTTDSGFAFPHIFNRFLNFSNQINPMDA